MLIRGFVQQEVGQAAPRALRLRTGARCREARTGSSPCTSATPAWTAAETPPRGRAATRRRDVRAVAQGDEDYAHDAHGNAPDALQPCQGPLGALHGARGGRRGRTRAPRQAACDDRQRRGPQQRLHAGRKAADNRRPPARWIPGNSPVSAPGGQGKRPVKKQHASKNRQARAAAYSAGMFLASIPWHRAALRASPSVMAYPL